MHGDRVRGRVWDVGQAQDAKRRFFVTVRNAPPKIDIDKSLGEVCSGERDVEMEEKMPFVSIHSPERKRSVMISRTTLIRA